jgi:hypothetical protein
LVVLSLFIPPVVLGLFMPLAPSPNSHRNRASDGAEARAGGRSSAQAAKKNADDVDDDILF